MTAMEVAARWNNIAGLAWNIIPIDNNTLLRLRKGDGHMITKEAAERVIETIEMNEALRAQLAAKDDEIAALTSWSASTLALLGWVLESSDRMPAGVVEAIQRLRENAPAEIQRLAVD